MLTMGGLFSFLDILLLTASEAFAVVATVRIGELQTVH